MIKKFIILLILLSLFSFNFSAQSDYTLEKAMKDAQEFSPNSRSFRLIESEKDLKLKNLKSKFLPQFGLNGQMTYQSETTGLDLNVPGFSVPRLSNDQYKVQIEGSQLIFDGNTIRIQKTIASLNGEIETTTSQIELEQLREQVLYIFFSILEIDNRIEALNLKKEDINALIKKTETFVNSGAGLSSQLKSMQVEMLKITQQETELKSLKVNQINVLNILTGTNQNLSTAFIIPKVQEATPAEFKTRPMFRLFTLQSEQLEQQKKLDFSLSKPKLLLFAQAGYGKPGLNFLKNQFTTYYLGGVRFQWNINNLYTSSRDKEINILQKQKIDVRNTTYELQVEIKLTALKAEINRYSDLLQNDEKIIALNKEIKDVIMIQFEKGTKTASDFIMAVNDENEAILNKKMHQLLLIKSNYLFKHHSGAEY